MVNRKACNLFHRIPPVSYTHLIKIEGHQSKGFHEKMLKFATEIGMGGLGYLEVQEDLSYKGPILSLIHILYQSAR